MLLVAAAAVRLLYAVAHLCVCELCGANQKPCTQHTFAM